MTDLREYILQQMKVKPTIDPDKEIRARIDFIKRSIMNSRRKGIVLGISGGQDSTLVGKLSQMAVSELREETGDTGYKFFALLLPYGEQRDIQDAYSATRFIQADEVINFNIKDSVDAIDNTFADIAKSNSSNSETTLKPLSDFHKGNAKARIRMTVQYAYAGEHSLLVVGCDHSAENVSGYFTRHGDDAADIVPIFGLNKRQGAQLLEALDAPEKLYTKIPIADLLDGNPEQSDEESLGMTYNEIDDYLEGRNVSLDLAEKLESRFILTDFKRHMPLNMYS